ncbi:MAG: DNA primase [Gemmatimonadetes bacterium]|nr:DNA primase [Gemmatimonadota bacterium]MYF72972.1 DNA primase [Gemmatimonadota bacterium]MYK51515.1 DNA primase [Gemmatimonadota bacterium]
MPRIPETIIDQVRLSIDIVDVVGDHVALTRRGKNFVGLCPFHDDSTPSLNVSQEKQIYKCFACGAGGNSFTFLRDIENISFIEAVRQLADRAGIALPDAKPADPDQQEVFDQIYRANELAVKYFHHLLTQDEKAADAMAYLENRGINRDVIDAFSLGYAPDQWDGFLQIATRRDFSPQILERAGLVLQRQTGGGFYDRFRNRITFPIHAATGRPVAFGARALDPDEQAKYINSPETPVYNKSATLYGLWRNRDAIRDAGVALVVEGYMDLIALAQYGIENAVASSGTALTTDQARLIRRYVPKTILIFDGDTAGATAAMRGIGSLFEVGLEVRVVTLPEDHDPDSYVRAHGPDGLLRLTENAASAIDFLIEQFAQRDDLSTVDGKTRTANALAELIGRITDNALKQFLIKDIAEKIGIDEKVLIGIAQTQRRTTRPQNGQPEPESYDTRPRSERELLTFLMQHPETTDSVFKQISPDNFTNSAYRQIATLIARNRQQKQSIEAAHLINQCNDERLCRILTDLSLEIGIENPNIDVPIQDYIHKFQLKSLESEIELLEKQLRQPLSPDDLRATLEKHRHLTAQRKAMAEPK